MEEDLKEDFEEEVVEEVVEEVLERVIESLGRRFFWVRSTGNIIAQREDMEFGVESTKEQDFEIYLELQGYNPEAIEMTTFEYEQYKEDFNQAKSWRFNPDTVEIEFSYPDPNVPEPETPVYRKPLSEEVDALKSADLDNKEAITVLFEMLIDMGV